MFLFSKYLNKSKRKRTAKIFIFRIPSFVIIARSHSERRIQIQIRRIYITLTIITLNQADTFASISWEVAELQKLNEREILKERKCYSSDTKQYFFRRHREGRKEKNRFCKTTSNCTVRSIKTNKTYRRKQMLGSCSQVRGYCHF